ncbi:MAG: hypothetical protein AAFX90_21705, partial [Pseudomonadota bacterium]
RSRKRQSKIEGCSTKPLPPKLKQKLNQSLHYQTASALRKTLTTDTDGTLSALFFNSVFL